MKGISSQQRLKRKRREFSKSRRGETPGVVIDADPPEDGSTPAISDDANLNAADTAAGRVADQLRAVSDEESHAQVEVNPRANLDAVVVKPYSRRNKYVMAFLRLRAYSRKQWSRRGELIPHLTKTVSDTWRRYIRRKLTPEELHQRQERKRRRKLAKTLTAEAVEIYYRLRNALTRNGLCHENKKNGKLQQVNFSNVAMSPEAAYFRVDVESLPFRVSINSFLDEAILRDLSGAVGRRVTADYRVGPSGIQLIVERSIGTRGIPNHVRFSDLLDWMPLSRNSYTIPLGITSNSTPQYVAITDLPHMLIAGTTGGGKSNFLNVILLTLLLRNTPAEFQLLLVDLKGGMELSHYAGVPHLMDVKNLDGGIAEEPSQVTYIMDYAIREMDRRKRLIKNAGFSDVVDYNARHYSDKIPRLLIAFDEIATLVNLSPRLAKKITAKIIEIGNIGRAVGVHFIVATQYPVKRNVDTAIKAVLNGKAAFSCGNLTASMTILGNGRAVSLSPPGRYIWQYQGGEREIQAAYLSDAQRQNLLDSIRSGNEVEMDRGHDVTLEEIFQFALDHTQGYLSRDRLYDHFSSRGITQIEVSNWLREAEAEVSRVGETYYKIIPAAGNRPRQLVPLDNVKNNQQSTIDK